MLDLAFSFIDNFSNKDSYTKLNTHINLRKFAYLLSSKLTILEASLCQVTYGVGVPETEQGIISVLLRSAKVSEGSCRNNLGGSTEEKKKKKKTEP